MWERVLLPNGTSLETSEAEPALVWCGGVSIPVICLLMNESGQCLIGHLLLLLQHRPKSHVACLSACSANASVRWRGEDKSRYP